jgi:hypothetical protein
MLNSEGLIVFCRRGTENAEGKISALRAGQRKYFSSRPPRHRDKMRMGYIPVDFLNIKPLRSLRSLRLCGKISYEPFFSARFLIGNRFSPRSLHLCGKN